MRVQQTVTQHSGPLPAPETLREYNLVNPTFAERIMQMAEADMNHLHKMDVRAQWMLFAENMGSRILGLGFAVTLLIIAAELAYAGHPWLAGTMVAALVGGMTVIILRQRANGGTAPPR